MEPYNHPVEMISVCGTDGSVTPMRFRYESSDDTLHTVKVTEIISMKPVSHVGVETMLFLCRTCHNGAEKLVELKYFVKTHRWVLFQVIC